MKIEISQGKKQSLFVYKNNILLFYSNINFNWRKKNIKIFDHNNDLVFELKSYNNLLLQTKFDVLFQNKEKLKEQIEINSNEMSLNESKFLLRKKNSVFSLNQNVSYFLNERKVADLKQKMWNFPQKILLDIYDEDLEILDHILIHVLATKTGDLSD